METSKGFERYIAHLCEGLGHADRHAARAPAFPKTLRLPPNRPSL